MMKSVLALVVAAASIASANRIVLNNDEWTFTNTGFGMSSGAGQFANNIASWLTDGTGGNNILILSQNFGLVESQFGNALASGGFNVTYNTSGANTADLSAYQAVFLAGNPVDNSLLTDYVNNGGNVYLAGGTGWGGSTQEAANWNPFLNSFGLGFGSFYNGVNGALTPPATHPIFNGVGTVYFNNGNNALDLVAGGNSQVVWNSGATGLIAVYDGNTAAVPEPGTMALFGMGMSAMAFAIRRRVSRRKA
jgi:hypothetical protein